MEKSENLGMQTFDGALFKLYRDNKITLDEALRNADSANNLRLKIKFHDQGKASSSGGFNLSLEDIDEGGEEGHGARQHARYHSIRRYKRPAMAFFQPMISVCSDSNNSKPMQ